MIAVDTNVLRYAHRAEFPMHVPSKAALDRLAASGLPGGTGGSVSTSSRRS
jgi:predicted nucleic acid-binding protein